MWVKICGITSVDDAVMTADAGADAIGLNFYPKSKRFVGTAVDASMEQKRPGSELSAVALAKTIRDAVSDQVDVVGVFVNSSVDDVAAIASQTSLTHVQFHGDETPEQIAKFHQHYPDIGIIRAFRVGDDNTDTMDQQLAKLKQLNVPLDAVLVDALVQGEYGGTGHTVNTNVLLKWMAEGGRTHRLILAGGLTPDNVAAAVQTVQPWGIDTASGVELSPGIKSPDKVKRFVDGAESAADSPDHRLQDR